jgi:hypothetical protein
MKICQLFHANGKTSIDNFRNVANGKTSTVNFRNVANALDVTITVMKATTRKRNFSCFTVRAEVHQTLENPRDRGMSVIPSFSVRLQLVIVNFISFHY